MDKNLHIAELIARSSRDKLDDEGQYELDRWLEEDPSHREIMKRTSDMGQQADKLKVYALFDQERVLGMLEEELFSKKSIRLNSQTIMRYAAAIILPLLILGGVAWLFLGQPEDDLMAEINMHIHPGSEKAVLVLSDGSSIELDPSKPLDVLEEGNATIRGAEREIHYEAQPEGIMKKRDIFNQLTTPSGGSYRLTLADGSRVWLNAGSTLRFPVSFHDTVRHVNLEGEAYFEVQSDHKPFIVQSGDILTRVLGTSFNVSAYGDDDIIRTTLVKGKVSVAWKAEGTPEGQSVVLEPDEQAYFHLGVETLSVAGVDASGYVSWVKGKLEFHQESLEQVMKSLSRWYDFEYFFENEAAKKLSFSARLNRSDPISEILEMLSLTTDVSFEYRGERIVVK